jgi:hypothetical protein
MSWAMSVFNRVTDDGVKVSDILDGAQAYEEWIANLMGGTAEGEKVALRRYEKYLKRIESDILEYWDGEISQDEASGRAAGLIEGFYEASITKDLL